jgi:two-component system, NarL family, sensor kinase
VTIRSMVDLLVRTLARMPSRDRNDLAKWVGVSVAGSIAVFALIGLRASADLAHNDNFYAPWQWVVGASAFVVGCVFVWNAPRHLMSWVMLGAAASVWATAGGSAILGRLTELTWYVRPVGMIGVSGWILCRGLLLVVAPLVYPDGVGRSPARRAFASICVVVVVANASAQAIGHGTFDLVTGEPAPWAEPWRDALPWLFRATFVVGCLANLDLMVRVLRAEAAERRRHALMTGFALVLALPGVIDLAHAANLLTNLRLDDLEFWAMTALPIVLAYGALRRRTLGFAVVVRRAVVYGSTVAIAAAVYALVVAAFAAVLSDGVGSGPIIATGLVAVALHPIRLGVDRLVRRRLFGDRDDPYQALARLGANLEASTSSGDSLQLVVNSVRDSMRCRAVAIDVVLYDGSLVRYGNADPRDAESETFAIVQEGREIGALVVAPREFERFAPGERELLSDLARAAGPVARAAQLVAELQRSRELLVVAREEERRRLRRDLHDGLGPTLASVAIGLEAAAERLTLDPEMSQLLHALEADLQEAIVDIRRLVHGLRPPALDDLGLLPALRQHADSINGRSGRAVRFEIEAIDDIGELPAAVEVAAFRIALEAMTNVVRHADATICRVRIRAGDTLEIEVEDDGRGLDPAGASGVGMASIRERSEELGGDAAFEPRLPTGVVVRARLPIARALA